MLAIERRDAIMATLEAYGSAMVSDLSAQLGVSEETIRRDLDKLGTQKKIRRVHGGAYLIKGVERTVPVELRRRFFVDEKKRIATRCVKMIDERDNIMLDCSTTALFIANEIFSVKKPVTVITNSLDIARVLGPCDFVSLISIGGTFKPETASFFGHMALSNLKEHYAHKAFVSCSSIHMGFGVTDHIESEAKIRAEMLAHSQIRILVADNTKFGSVSAHRLTGLDRIDRLVTDAPLDGDWQKVLEDSNVEIIVAEV